MIRRIPRLPLRGKRHFWLDPHIITTFTESYQTIHSYSHLPWWALIPTSTFILRTIYTLPLSILQRKRLQKQKEFKAIISGTNPILKLNLGKEVMKAKAELARITSDPNILENAKATALQNPKATMGYEAILTLSAKETRKVQKALFKKHGIQLWKNLILPSCQIPLWIVMSLTMRDLSGWLSWDKLSNTPLDSSLYNEGILWFSDLTTFDQMHIIPIVYGIIYLCNIEWTAKSLELLQLVQRNTLRPTIIDSLTNLSRMSVVFMMAISFHAPTALTLYWISSQLYSLIQNVLLDLLFPISYTPYDRINPKLNTNQESQPLINKQVHVHHDIY